MKVGIPFGESLFAVSNVFGALAVRFEGHSSLRSDEKLVIDVEASCIISRTLKTNDIVRASPVDTN